MDTTNTTTAQAFDTAETAAAIIAEQRALERPLYVVLANLVVARGSCNISGRLNPEWYTRHTARIRALVEQHFPHGSGFDNGTTMPLADSRPDRLILCTSYHHMDEQGGYDGWTDHQVIVTPSLAFGYRIRVTGVNRNGIKDYIGELFSSALDTYIEAHPRVDPVRAS